MKNRGSLFILDRFPSKSIKIGGIRMTQNEMELIRTIRESEDPAKALAIAIQIITEYLETTYR